VAVRQHEDGTMTVRPIEEFLLLEPRTGGLPLDAQRLAVSAQGRIEEARAFMVATVAKEFAQKHRDRLNADLASRIEFLRQGFFYEQKELVGARTVWSKRRREGHPSAEREVDLGGGFVRVTHNHEVLRWLPEPEQFLAIPCFAKFQQRLIASQILFRGRQS